MYSEIILDKVRIFNHFGLLGGNIVIIDRESQKNKVSIFSARIKGE